MGVKFTRWTLQKLNLLILSPFPSSPTNIFTSPVAPWLPTAMRLHCVPLPAPGPPRTKTTLGPKRTCTMSRFWELHRFADKDARAQKNGWFNLGFWKKRLPQSGCKNPTLNTANCEGWDSVEHDPKGHGFENSRNKQTEKNPTSWIEVGSESQRGEHQSGKCRKTLINVEISPNTLHNKHYRIHASMGCLHIPPNCIRMLLCINPVKKEECLFSGFSEKSKARTNFFPGRQKISWNWKPIPAGVQAFLYGQTESLTSSVVVMFQWKSESPWKTQCGKKGLQKDVLRNQAPKKIGKACTPSHATLLLKVLHHWHGFLTGFVSKRGFVDWFFHDFLCCPNSPTVLYAWRWKWCLYRSVTFLPNQWPPARSHIYILQ